MCSIMIDGRVRWREPSSKLGARLVSCEQILATRINYNARELLTS
jgi:hypothetical protein